MAKMPNKEQFLKDLDTISRKNGVWIENDPFEGANLIDEGLDTIARGLALDDDTQEYYIETDEE